MQSSGEGQGQGRPERAGLTRTVPLPWTHPDWRPWRRSVTYGPGGSERPAGGRAGWVLWLGVLLVLAGAAGWWFAARGGPGSGG